MSYATFLKSKELQLCVIVSDLPKPLCNPKEMLSSWSYFNMASEQSRHLLINCIASLQFFQSLHANSIVSNDGIVMYVNK